MTLLRSIPRSAFTAVPRAAAAATPGARRMILTPLRDQVDEIAHRLGQGESAEQILTGVLPGQEELAERRESIAIQLAVEGWNIGGALLGKRAYAQYEAKALSVNPVFFGADELVANFLGAQVGEWIAMTSRLESETTAERYGRIVRSAIEGFKDPRSGEFRSPTPPELARIFKTRALAQSDGRANLMARTLTNWAYNEGATGVYQDSGVQMGEWVATLDEVTGEWDASLNGTLVRLGETFVAAGDTFRGSDGSVQTAGIDVTHPPLHPNCRCTIVPVL